MFDDIIENHNVHKIEQNNDVYCVASGVPDVTNKHTMNSCDFLLEIMDRITTFRISSLPDVSIQLRAGAHTGKVWLASDSFSSRYSSTLPHGFIPRNRKLKSSWKFFINVTFCLFSFLLPRCYCDAEITRIHLFQSLLNEIID